MDLVPTPEQEEIAASAAAFLAKELPLSRIRQLADEPSSVDPQVWAAAADLGWLTLGLPEDLGGVGYGLPEEVMLFREIGRHLAPGPFVASVLGARLAARAGNEELAEAIGRGRRVGLALVSDQPSTAVGERVDGRLMVVDGLQAEWILVATPSGSAVVAASALSDVSPVPCIDDVTRLFEASIRGAEAASYLPGDEEDIFGRGVLLVSAMLTGIAEATRDAAVAHAKSRVQGGQPIGAYQAIKHPCAEMAVRAEAAGAQLFFAAAALQTGRNDAAFQTSASRVVAADAARRNAAANVQIHGGMGFTFEHEAHLYVKRAHVLAHTFGTPTFHLSAALESGPAK